MRFVLTALLWLVTTVAAGGRSTRDVGPAQTSSTQTATPRSRNAPAADPALQQAMAAELTTQLVTLAANTGYDVQTDVFGARRRRTPGVPPSPVSSPWPTGSPTAGCSPTRCPAIRSAGTLGDRPRADAGRQFVAGRPCRTSASRRLPPLPVPLTKNAPASHCGPDSSGQAATWGPWVSVGGDRVGRRVRPADHWRWPRRRGKALAALGVSALLVGAAGWAGLEVGRRYVGKALVDTSGDVRQIADVVGRVTRSRACISG